VQAFAWLRGLLAIGEEVACVVKDPVDEHGVEGLHVFSGYQARGSVGYLTHQAPFLTSVIEEFRPDYVYQGAAGAITGLVALLARRHGFRFVHRLANDADVDPRMRRRMRTATRICYAYGLRKASAVLCQTGYQSSQLRQRHPEKPTLKIYNPIWLAEIPEGCTESDGEYVAWLGLFQRQKDLPALLSVARSLPDLRFALAGRAVGRVDAGTRSALAELRQLPNVDFVGYLRRAEVHAFLGRAHALISTSRFEGFPNTYLEAWSVGTPVVTLKSADPDGVVEREGLGAVGDTTDELLPALQGIVDAGRRGPVNGRCLEYVRREHDAMVLSTRLRDWLAATFSQGNRAP